MKLELEQQLVNTYPKIFSEYGGDPKQTCMAFGFECGDGWYNIIDILCGEIDHYCDWYNDLFPHLKIQVVAEQVKEKYGSLRFYSRYTFAENLEDHDYEKVTKCMKYIDGMITMAESFSERTCEQCGGASVLDKNMPFPRSMCDACQTIHDDERSSKNWT